MLINNINSDRRASIIVKNSMFYIEVAKFVQAYTTIINNPNEFLNELGQTPIDESKQHLTWEQLMTIMQNCDLGFENKPSRTDLVVYYNYALEIGSVDSFDKKLASVDDVAEAQKHYYNFVDEAKDRAEDAYLKQRRIVEMRNREAANAENEISKIKAGNVLSSIMMFIFVMIGIVGLVSFVLDNKLVQILGSIIPVWKAQYIGAIMLVVVSLIFFAIFNNLFVKTKRKYLKLKQATETIFKRDEETYAVEQFLKRKLDMLKKDFEVVKTEINDKTKKYDVKHSIEVLKTTNKYYQKLCENEEEFASVVEKTTGNVTGIDEEEFAPVKLTKEQEENLRSVNKAAINLEGQIDKDAFFEKFEKSENSSEPEKDEQKEDKQEEQQQKEDEQKENEKKINEQNQKNQEILDSVDYIKDILGFSMDENEKN